jgi:hypothetical protein
MKYWEIHHSCHKTISSIFVIPTIAGDLVVTDTPSLKSRV